jgi:hypothetical protein
MKTLIKTLCIALLFLLPVLSFGQKAPIKLGDVSKQVLEMNTCEHDPDAEAVVLCDYGYRTWSYRLTDGEWIHNLKRICRIKIFNNDGYSWATETISLYDDGDIQETVGQIKGFTYNLENGKIVKTKLSKENIFKEKSGENRFRLKFTLPNVKEGSVIEFQYTVSSNFHTILEPWYFQHSIPVQHSEYIIAIPEYFRYIQNSLGFEKFHTYETSSSAGSISWTKSNRPQYSGGNTSGSGSISSGKVDFVNTKYHYVAKDMPALKDEAFVGNSDNYLQSVGFQLSKFKGFSGRTQNILGEWPEVVSRFIDDYETFGRNMRPRGFYKDITDPIMEKYATAPERIAAVYAFVSNYMKWNEVVGYIPDQNIKQTFDERTGSAPDINALLISMLRAVELEADPVILSTISNGQVHPIYPILDKYNYMIARVMVGDQYLLLDATAKHMPAGLLPTRCLNQRGYAISKTRPGWVKINPRQGYERSTMCMLNMTDDGVMHGSINSKESGYNGLKIRSKLRSDGEEKYVEDFKSAHTGWAINDIKVENPEPISKPVKQAITGDISNHAEVMGRMIYIDPILIDKIEENPFKQEERKLPIEFVIPIKNSYMLNLEIPEGYAVEELPEQINLRTPDKSAHLKYLVQVNGNRIQVVHSWGIDKTFYPPNAFAELKEFYALLVAKQSEQIVLKKVDTN